jgi:ribonuclease HI
MSSVPPAFRYGCHAYTPPPYLAPPPPRRIVVAHVQWTRPAPGWHKLNFDGSVHHDGSGRASIGGVIRDSYGRTVLAFGERTPHAGVGEVEARALIHGLHLALQNGCDRLVVEGDDLTLVRLLRGDSPHTRIPWAMYNQIVQLLSYFRDVVVQHVYREGNAVADALCHEAYRCSNLWTDHQLVPPAVRAKLEDDRRGVVHPRYRSA